MFEISNNCFGKSDWTYSNVSCRRRKNKLIKYDKKTFLKKRRSYIIALPAANVYMFDIF